jgi:AcrR family transcriptional regulator
MAAVAESGLTVSLDHLRLEDVIREAGVSRTTVYRRWPQKDQFLGDLLLELARASAPMATVGGAEATALIKQTVDTHRAWLDTAEGRAQLAAEVIRVTAWLDFERIRSAPQWRTYLALTSTFVGLPDGELRSKVQRALAESERVFTERIAVSNRIATGLLGLRLRPGTGVSFETIAQLANGLLRGLITKSLTMPEIATARTAGTLAGLQADWSLPGLGLAAIVGSFTEPDPGVRWDDARTEALLRTLDATDDLFDQARPEGPGPAPS